MADDSVGRVTALDPAESLLVAAFRSAAVALGEGRRDAWREVGTAIGGLAAPGCRRAAMRHFRALMTTLGVHARRPLRFHLPACPCLGADEALFLDLYRQSRLDARCGASSLAHALVEADAAAALLRHVTGLATQLCARPAPCASQPPGAPAAETVAAAAPRLH